MQTVRIGTVEAVKGKRIFVRFRGKGDTAELTAIQSSGYGRWIPNVGDKVVCLMLSESQGFVVGNI